MRGSRAPGRPSGPGAGDAAVGLEHLADHRAAIRPGQGRRSPRGGEAVHRDLLAVPLTHRLQCDPGARALHIHKQTLGYRIRKIVQLTGRVR